jgi:hypothetical protein
VESVEFCATAEDATKARANQPRQEKAIATVSENKIRGTQANATTVQEARGRREADIEIAIGNGMESRSTDLIEIA